MNPTQLQESPETDVVIDLRDDLRDDAAGSPAGASLGTSPALKPEQKRVSPAVAIAAVALLALFVVRGGAYRVLLVGLAFGLMILLHELGHFLTARLTGMKATEFFVGFGPRVWSFRRGETEYGIKALPLGGYVKILGMNNLDKIEDPADEPRTYRQATFPRRVLVASAGTLMHLLIAFVLLMVVFCGTGRLRGTEDVRVAMISPTLEGAASPAVTAGFREGDTIYSIEGQRITSTDAIAQAVRPKAGVPLRVQLGRDGQLINATVTPVSTTDDDGTVIGRIGIESTSLEVTKSSLIDGARGSVSEIYNVLPQTFNALGDFFAPSHLKTYGTTLVEAGRTPSTGEKKQDANRFQSLPGTVDTLADASRVDIRWALELFAIINVSVGVFNMLPLLPLDGGHVLVAFYERLRSRKGKRYRVNVAKLLPLTYAVMTLILAIGLSSLYLDIRDPLHLF